MSKTIKHTLTADACPKYVLSPLKCYFTYKQVDFCRKVFASDGQLSELHDDQQINLQFGDIMH